jgi:hypothetical protein
MSNNGSGPPDVVAMIREHVRALEEQRDGMLLVLAETKTELARWQRALHAVTDEPQPKPKPKPARKAPSKISPERLSVYEDVIRGYAAEHIEFRQKDIAELVGGGTGQCSIAFRVLRDQQVIRLARKDGMSHWFRLTKKAGVR